MIYQAGYPVIRLKPLWSVGEKPSRCNAQQEHGESLPGGQSPETLTTTTDAPIEDLGVAAALNLTLGDQIQIVTSANGSQFGVFISAADNYLIAVELNDNTPTGMALAYNDLMDATVYKL